MIKRRHQTCFIIDPDNNPSSAGSALEAKLQVNHTNSTFLLCFIKPPLW